MPEEKVQISFEATGASKFDKDLTQGEFALRRQARAIDEHVRSLQKEIVELRNADNPNRQRITALSKQTQELRLSAQAIRAQISALQDEKRQLDASTVSFGEFATGIRQLNTVTFAGVAVFGTLSAAIGASIKSFGEFEKSLNSIQAVSGATSGEINAIKAAALKMGAETIFTVQQVADSFLTLAKAGFTTQESLDAMPGLLALAAASGTDLASSVDTASGILRSFNLEAKETGRIADVLAKTANESSSDVSDLGEAYKQLGPIASTTNQTLEGTATVLGILSNSMIKGGDAGSDLRNLLTRLTGTTKEVRDALAQLGVSAVDQQGKFRPLIDIILDLQKGLQKLPDAKKLRLEEAIAGAENIKTLSVLVNTSAAAFDKMQDSLDNAAGAAQETADVMQNGVGNAVEQLGGSLDALAKIIGEQLAPAFVQVTHIVTEFLNEVGQNEPLLRLLRTLSDITVQVLDTAGAINNVLSKAFNDSNALIDGFTGALKLATLPMIQIESLANLAAAGIDRITAALSNLVHGNFEESLNQLSGLIGDISRAASALSNNQAAFLGKGQSYTFGELLKGTPGGLPAILPGENIFDSLGRAAGGKQSPLIPRRRTIGGPPIIDKKKKNAKKGPSASTIENRRLNRVREQFSTNLRKSNIDFDQQIADLGPFATNANNAAKMFAKLDAEAKILHQTLTAISNLKVTTEESRDAKEKALDDISVSLRKNKLETTQLANEQKKYNFELNRTLTEFQDQKELILSEGDLNRYKTQLDSVGESLSNQFEEGYISAKDYYKQLDGLAYESYQAENELLQQQIDNIQYKISTLTEAEKAEGKQVELNNQIVELHEKQKDFAQQYGKELEKNTQALTKFENRFTKQLVDGVTQSLEQAIVGVFTGDNILDSIKQLGKSLKQVFAQTFASAIGEALKEPLTNLLKPLGDALAGIANGKGGGIKGIFSAISGIGKTGIGKVLGVAGIAGSAFGGFQSGKSGGLLAGGLTGTVGGALAGAVFGPVGAIIGGAVGGTAGLLGGLFGKKGKKAAKKVEKEQKAADKLTKKINSILSGIDTNNLFLDDLNARQAQISGLKAKGKAGKAAKKEGLAQIQQLIAQRQAQIQQAIEQIREDNLQLNNELAVAQAEPFKKAALEKQQALDTLARDTQKALAQFRDSEAAKTEILANEAVKRKLIEEDIRNQFKETAETLSELFQQRGELANSDVFTRAKTRSAQKAEDIATLDKKINETIASFNEFDRFGLTPQGVAGFNTLQNAVRAITQTNSFQITINGATDPVAVSEQVRRSVEEFLRRNGVGDVA